MNQSKTILFFGNELLATGVTTDTPILKALVSNGYNVAAIITAPNSNLSSRHPRVLEVANFAETHNIPLLELSNLKQSAASLKLYGASLGVLAAFGRMVPQEIIDLLPFGIINIHPSLLPSHRGPTPIESAILAGDQQTGVCLMQLVAAMDAGPLFDQKNISLKGTESKQSLADNLGKIGAERLISILPKVLKGNAAPTPQNGAVTYDKRLESTQGFLDYNLPAVILERQIRAFLGWPRSKTVISDLHVVITQAHVVGSDNDMPTGKFISIDGQLAVTTKEGLLSLDRLIPAGGKEMSGTSFLLGHPLKT